MGKWDVDFDDYEDKGGAGYEGEVPKKGTYDAKLISLKEHTSGAGNEGLEWIFEITEGEFAGWRGWVYTNMESAKWKTQQVVKAISGGKEDRVSLKPMGSGEKGEDSPTVKKAKPVRIRVTRETYEDEARAKIRTVMVSENAKPDKKKKEKKGDDPF